MSFHSLFVFFHKHLIKCVLTKKKRLFFKYQQQKKRHQRWSARTEATVLVGEGVVLVRPPKSVPIIVSNVSAL